MGLNFDLVEAVQIAVEVARQHRRGASGIGVFDNLRLRIPAGERLANGRACRPEVHETHLRSPRRNRQLTDW